MGGAVMASMRHLKDRLEGMTSRAYNLEQALCRVLKECEKGVDGSKYYSDSDVMAWQAVENIQQICKQALDLS
jgi:hypothetical protein